MDVNQEPKGEKNFEDSCAKKSLIEIDTAEIGIHEISNVNIS